MSAVEARVFLCAALVAASALCSLQTPGAARAAAPDTTVSIPAAVDSVDRLRVAPRSAADERASEEERERIKRTLELMGRSEVEGDKLWQRRKSGKVAMFSSALLPGLGQVYNGRRIKVAVMVGFASGYFAQILLNTKEAQRARALRDRLEPGTSKWSLQNRLSKFYEDEARTWVWWSGAVWIIGILDAWTDAHLYDIRAYTPPRDLSSSLPEEPPTRYVAVTLPF